MNDCDAWLSLVVTILKIVLAVLEMAKARRGNELLPRSWTVKFSSDFWGAVHNGEPPQQS